MFATLPTILWTASMAAPAAVAPQQPPHQAATATTSAPPPDQPQRPPQPLNSADVIPADVTPDEAGSVPLQSSPGSAESGSRATADPLPANLLSGGESDEPSSPRPRLSPANDSAAGTEEESDDARAERVRAYYRALYRPPDNPLSLGATARGIFTLLDGNDDETSGRVGGVSGDFWLRWNHVGVGLSAFVLGGQVAVGEERVTNASVLTGGGPSIGLGRLSLIGRGFLDLSLGYDFAVMPGTKQTSPGAPSTQVTFAPHGPRARVDFGLVAPSKRTKRRFNGFGASLGFQYLVGDLTGSGFSPSAMLSLGLCYYGT